MISICIPIYNFDVSSLVHAIGFQINNQNKPIEIILIDDCSEQYFKEKNAAICNKYNYIELEKNIGRSKIRNLFLSYAQYDHLLFLDCDSLIESGDFLQNYINALIDSKKQVICGGRVYPSLKPEKKKRLNWEYGRKKESLSCSQRQLFPNKSFMTNNFIIEKKLFSEIKFDERLSEYGHEDTLFGFELKRKGIVIHHIENPVLNGDIEDNAVFLEKTEKGIRNLVFIARQSDTSFENEVALLTFYHQLKKKHFTIFIDMLFPILKPFIVFFLVKGYVNLNLFDFYKLGILNQFLSEKTEKQ